MTTIKIHCSDKLIIDKLYRNLGPMAVSKTRYLVENLEMAQDIVQDAFVKLFQSHLEFESELQAYKWIYKVCHHMAIDHLRSRSVRVKWNEPIAEMLYSQPSLPHERLANQQIFAKILHRLDERESLILGYIVIDGLSHLEISELMGVSTKTIQRSWQSLSKIIANLKEMAHD